MTACSNCGHQEPSNDRTLAQNRLQHKWYACIGKQTGNTSDAIRAFCKLRFGMPILMADDEDFSRRWTLLANQLDYTGQLHAAFMVPMTSIMSVEEMSEFLNQVDIHYTSKGLYLPTREMPYWEAMGEAA